jgi:hypothetical protein
MKKLNILNLHSITTNGHSRLSGIQWLIWLKTKKDSGQAGMTGFLYFIAESINTTCHFNQARLIYFK